MMMVMAAITVAITLRIIQVTYFSLPLFDAWDYWRSYPGFLTSPFKWLLAQHNEHRILVPRLFFLLDHHLFGASNVFLLTCIVLIQGAHILLISHFICRGGKLSTFGTVATVSGLTVALFSAQQFTNFTWGFQIQFVLVYFAAAGSFAALVKGSKAARANLWVWVGCASGVVATFSMANGLFVWPLMMLCALCLRLRKRYLLLIFVVGIACAALYLHGYVKPPNQTADPWVSLGRLPQVMAFMTTYLGSPTDDLLKSVMVIYGVGSENVRLLIMSLVGGVGLICASVVCLLALRGRFSGNEWAAGLFHMLTFIIITSFVTALGRITFPLIEAATPRYKTPAILFWTYLIGLGLIDWVKHRGTSDSASNLVLKVSISVLLFLVFVLHQTSWLEFSKDYARTIGEGEIAVVNGVFDEPYWLRVYHTPSAMIEPLTGLRKENLSVFSEAWLHWRGDTVGSHFSLGTGCTGSIDTVSPVKTPMLKGTRVVGWAWQAGRPSSNRVILTDDHDRIQGFARTKIQRRPDVQQALGEAGSEDSGWVGYIPGEMPGVIVAYLLQSDGHACKAASWQQHNSSS
jgi:hypothetical protein